MSKVVRAATFVRITSNSFSVLRVLSMLPLQAVHTTFETSFRKSQ